MIFIKLKKKYYFQQKFLRIYSCIGCTILNKMEWKENANDLLAKSTFKFEEHYGEQNIAILTVLSMINGGLNCNDSSSLKQLAYILQYLNKKGLISVDLITLCRNNSVVEYLQELVPVSTSPYPSYKSTLSSLSAIGRFSEETTAITQQVFKQYRPDSSTLYRGLGSVDMIRDMYKDGGTNMFSISPEKIRCNDPLSYLSYIKNKASSQDRAVLSLAWNGMNPFLRKQNLPQFETSFSRQMIDKHAENTPPPETDTLNNVAMQLERLLSNNTR
jgi:hypothetical protein